MENCDSEWGSITCAESALGVILYGLRYEAKNAPLSPKKLFAIWSKLLVKINNPEIYIYLRLGI